MKKNRSLIREILHGFTIGESNRIMVNISRFPVNCSLEYNMRKYRELWDKEPERFKRLFGFTPKFAK